MIDLTDTQAVLNAAKPFDRSYVEGRSTVMLAGQEIVGFTRHMVADQAQCDRSTPGRRAGDHELEDLRRINTEQLSRIQYLEHALAVTEARINKGVSVQERRMAQVPFDGADRRSKI